MHEDTGLGHVGPSNNYTVVAGDQSGVFYSTVEGATKAACEVVRTTGKRREIWMRVATIVPGEPRVIK